MNIYPNSIIHTRCKRCRRNIAFAITFPNRKSVPLDVPIRTQNIRQDADRHQLEELVSTTHFATCPEYNQPAKPLKPLTQPKLF